jgi:DNA repair and recombination protein RAD54B
MFKPFKPPLPKSVARPPTIDLTAAQSEDEQPSHRPLKKRRLLDDDESSPISKPTTSAAALAHRKPLLAVKNPTEIKVPEQIFDASEGYYIVLW